jgi:hypothetical protein
MARYAVILGGTVENVIEAASLPVIAGRTVVQSTTAGPGDTYNGSTFAPRVPTPSEVRASLAGGRLLSSRARLQQIRDQAAANATGAAFANLTTASTAIRLLAGAMADLAQNILDLELIAAYQQDNGTD